MNTEKQIAFYEQKSKNEEQKQVICEKVEKAGRKQPPLQEMQKSKIWHQSIRNNGKRADFERLIKNTPQINSFDYDFRTPFHIACSSGNLEAIEFLAENGASTCQLDRFGCTPLHYAPKELREKIQGILENVRCTQDMNVHKNLSLESSWNIFDNQFKDQAETVFAIMVKENVFNTSVISHALDYFYNRLGLDPLYFKLFTATQINKHVHAYIIAQHKAEIAGNKADMTFSMQDNVSAFYLCTLIQLERTEAQVEEHIQKVSQAKALYVTSFKSKFCAAVGLDTPLYIYFLLQENYENPDLQRCFDIYRTCSPGFLGVRNYPIDIDRHQRILHLIKDSTYPQFIHEKQDNMTVLMWGVVQGFEKEVTHSSYLQELRQIFDFLGIVVIKKFIETFSNGVVISTFYVPEITDETVILQLRHFSNIIFLLPKNPLTQHYLNSEITSQELMFFTSAATFAYYFISEQFSDYSKLYDSLKTHPDQLKSLVQMKMSTSSEKISFSSLWQNINENLTIFQQLYINFSLKMQKAPNFNKHKMFNRLNSMSKKETLQGSWKNKESQSQATVESPLKLQDSPLKQQEFYNVIDINEILVKLAGDKDKAQLFNIIKSFMTFTESIVKTNFYQVNKAALAYRLDPKVFMDIKDYDEIPFGIFMVIGSDFQGFHVRFREIARGGVRLIKYNKYNFQNNLENYNLGYTQKLKNKDILESGSKGTILMLKDRNHMMHKAFMSYVDAILSLIMKDDQVLDFYIKDEIIFLGPDENTADLMDEACLYARAKGYKFWKAFTTGKSIELGGIPHDRYGMTTRSVRAYVNGIKQMMGLGNTVCTKVMTGGPDGDLGSNEIKMGSEKIIAVIDGSGVLCDIDGIDQETLVGLAESRQMVDNYNGPLSPNGYLVKLSDKNVKLPNGQVALDGESFRNSFHLNQDITADFFIPCGGRPEAVNLVNVEKMFMKQVPGSENIKVPRFKYIVEGANLFISESARAVLEAAGVILFKDSSANKGGVTSSSYEVMAAMSLNDNDFKLYMTPTGHVEPEFYREYVKHICKVIESNAKMEFEFIWNVKQEFPKKSLTQISNDLSHDINNLFDVILNDDENVFDNVEVRNNVIRKAVPEQIIKLVGFENLVKNLPEAYQRSLVASFLAKEYYYQFKTNSTVYKFYTFMKKFEMPKHNK